MSDRAYQKAELRAEGRTLTGTVLRYGSVSPDYRERFEPGAFVNLGSGTKWLNLGHDRSRVLAYENGGGLTFEDSAEALRFRAKLPDLPLSGRVLREIESGKLSGISVEFHSQAESRDANNVRVIQKALLDGVGLVDYPAYPDSRIAEIRRSAGTLKATIPYNSNVACECYRGSGNCNTVSFVDKESLVLPDNLFAIWRSYAGPLASRSKGTLQIENTDKGLNVQIALPDTSYGRDIVEASAGTEIYVRPLFDADSVEAKEIEVDGEKVAQLSNVPVKALLVGPTAASDGWPEATVKGRENRSKSGRGALWLL